MTTKENLNSISIARLEECVKSLTQQFVTWTERMERYFIEERDWREKWTKEIDARAMKWDEQGGQIKIAADVSTRITSLERKWYGITVVAGIIVAVVGWIAYVVMPIWLGKHGF